MTRREKYLLNLIYPDGSLAVGLSVAEYLHQKGYLSINREGRYVLTRKGMIAVVSNRGARTLTVAPTV